MHGAEPIAELLPPDAIVEPGAFTCCAEDPQLCPHSRMSGFAVTRCLQDFLRCNPHMGLAVVTLPANLLRCMKVHFRIEWAACTCSFGQVEGLRTPCREGQNPVSAVQPPAGRPARPRRSAEGVGCGGARCDRANARDCRVCPRLYGGAALSAEDAPRSRHFCVVLR